MDIAVKNADGVTIYYNYINNNTELEVTYNNSLSYRGHKVVVIPEKVTYMSRTRKVTSIGKWAFGHCSNLTSITIPNSVTSIGENAFWGCYSLISILIPRNVMSIGEKAFFDCRGLTSVHISDLESWCNISFRDESSNPLSYAHHLFLNAVEIKDLVIPDSVTVIGFRAFADCCHLISIRIGNNVKSIGACAFWGCSRLTSITIGKSVTSIGNFAFRNCSGMTSITIPHNVTNIGNGAFSGCWGLTSVHISDMESWCKISFGDESSNPLSYAHHLFLNAVEIKDLVIPDSVTSIGSRAFADCCHLISIRIGNSVKSIGNYAFYKCSHLTSIAIGNGVTNIDNGAFGSCNSLTSITIPHNVKNIGEGAFWGCKNLNSITIGNGVTSIGVRAFYDCYCLTSITIPHNVTNIGNGAFSGCWGLTSVHISDMESWCKISFGDESSNPLFYAHHLFLNEVEIKDLVIPDSVTSIGSYAFYKCSNLTSIAIGNGVTNIDYGAFWYCSSLTSITIPNNVTSIGDRAFADCSILTSITIGNGVMNLGDEVFAGCCSLTSITLGNGVMRIGRNAFEDCDKLLKVISNIENPFGVISNWFSNPFCENKFYHATLYVPIGTIDKYKVAYGWKEFACIEEREGETSPNPNKCATPTIAFKDRKLVFECETEGVDFICHITPPASIELKGNNLCIPSTYTITVYAKKDGFENSETVTQEVELIEDT